MFRSFIERAVVVWVVLLAVIVGVGAVAGAAWLLMKSVTVLIMLLIAVLLAVLLNPVVDGLSRGRLPRWGAVVLVYLAIAGILAAISLLVIPLIIRQGTDFGRWINSPQNPVIQFFRWAHDPANQPEPDSTNPLMQRVLVLFKSYQAHVPADAKKLVAGRMDELSRAGGTFVKSILDIAVTAAEWTFRGIIILVMSIYLLLDKQNYTRWFHERLPERNRRRLEGLLADLSGVLGGYLRGLGMMILFVGCAVSLLLLLFHIKYWLFIGVMAGLLEVIPYFGAVAGAVPAVILGFQKSAGIGALLIVLFVAINQIEGHVVAPMAMGHNLHLRPLTVLLSLLIGAEVHGVGGMIIAVPAVAIARVLWIHARRYFEETPEGPEPSLKESAAHAMNPAVGPEGAALASPLQASQAAAAGSAVSSRADSASLDGVAAWQAASGDGATQLIESPRGSVPATSPHSATAPGAGSESGVFAAPRPDARGAGGAADPEAESQARERRPPGSGGAVRRTYS